MKSNWISVKDRLPEITRLVISDKVMIAMGIKDKQIRFGWLRNNEWVTEDMNPYARQDLITHWMPLPDAPHEETHENTRINAQEKDIAAMNRREALDEANNL